MLETAQRVKAGELVGQRSPRAALPLLLAAFAGLILGCERPVASLVPEFPVVEAAHEGSIELIQPEANEIGPDESRSFDFGKVIEGSDLRHTFLLRNTSAKPLTVIGVKKSCGCETANVSVGTIVPGGGELEVTYALSKYGAGERKGQLVITTDSEEQSLRLVEFKLRAEIQAKIWATPGEIELMEGDESKSEQVLRVESLMPGLLDSFREVTTNRGNAVVTLAEHSADALKFRVAMSPDAPWGTSYDLIYLSFDNRERPSLNVRVRMRKGHPLAIIPAMLKLAPMPAGETAIRRVRILSPGGASSPFRITKVEAPGGIVVGELPSEPRHMCDVNMTFHETPADAPERAVVFHTDPPGAVTLSVRYGNAMLTNAKESR